MPRHDPLHDTLKAHEHATRHVLPRRSYTVIRVDGQTFRTYTRDLERPFDATFAGDMDAAAIAAAAHTSGFVFAYVQSDEISLLLTDVASENHEPWFGGVLPKLISVTASAVTATFNQRRTARRPGAPLALFDARAFTLPDEGTVAEYFMWRQRDASKNSISMAASAHFSHGQLKGLNSSDKRELLLARAGIDWADYPAEFRQGRVITRESYQHPTTFTPRGTTEAQTVESTRTRWTAATAPRFDDEPDGWLRSRIPARATRTRPEAAAVTPETSGTSGTAVPA